MPSFSPVSGGPVSSDASTPPPAMVNTVWNRSDFNAAYNISDNGLLAAKSATAGSGTNCGRANNSESSGKWIYSFVYYTPTTSGTGLIVGFANSSATLSNYVGSDTNSFGYDPINGRFYFNGSYTSTTAAATGNTIDLAVDFGAKLLWARINGSSTWLPSGNPASGTGGFSFSGFSGAAFPAMYSYTGDIEVDANFGAISPTYTAPSGFSYFDSTYTPSNTMTWSTVDISSNYTLSGGNLIATKNSSTANTVVRSAAYQSTGSWYFEMTPTGSAYAVGFGNIAATLTDYLGLDSAALAYYGDGRIISNGTTTGTYATYASGAVVSVAFNATTKTVWFAVNGGSWLPSGSPAAGTGGLSYSGFDSPNIFPMGMTESNAGTVTFNPGPTFAYTVPSGFQAFDYTPPATPIEMSKLLSYATLGQGGAVEMSKLVSATILAAPNMQLSKLVSYAVLSPAGAQDPQLIIMS